ncbi:MAG: acyl-CoA thioesterase [Gammaproteobacteria bacterium]|nr:acyl-CoA thioesterase [Gammaproteobacteria bacterium]MBU1832585.1 acyl-CoA thioesterase [Gammaproteobacteria bacterium]
MSDKPAIPSRAEFPHFAEIQTRWHDNDVYQHINNVVYYSFFDTAVNQHLINSGALDIANSPAIGLVIETQCRYYSAVSFPDLVTVGIKVEHLGNSSVRYQTALFRNDEDSASAVGNFVHVYVDRKTNRPVSIPDNVRAVLATLCCE